MISQSDAGQYIDAYNSQCKPAITPCTDTAGSDSQCARADGSCRQAVEDPLEESANFDVYDIRADQDSFPPGTYSSYLNSAAVKRAIGATSQYAECGDSDIGSSDSKSTYPHLTENVRLTIFFQAPDLSLNLYLQLSSRALMCSSGLAMLVSQSRFICFLKRIST